MRRTSPLGAGGASAPSLHDARRPPERQSSQGRDGPATHGRDARATRLAVSIVAAVLAGCASELAAGRRHGEAGLCPGEAGFKAAEHPFMLWTRADLAVMRKRVETQEWAKAALQRWLAHKNGKVRELGRLVQYAALGDKDAGQKEKAELMRVLRSPIPRGGAQWITVLRYDLLYGELTAEERKAFEEMARIYIDNAIFQNAVFNPKIFNDSRRYSRYDARKYTRTNWLPNIIWPRKVSANLMAAALRDEKLIRRTWAAYGSWKWYFDEYLCDIGFYSEEFSKMGATPGAMLVYCLAVERLGLNELGFGYTGKGGATMRGHIEGLLHLGYPRIDVGSTRPQYPMLTIGDLRQVGSSQSWNLPSPAFQHSLVMGYTADGGGGTVRWKAHGAWGGVIRGKHAQWDGYGGFTPKMQIPLWFELGHARWPQAGFGYFLAQMRAPNEKRYMPSLLFGLEPIDPREVEAPPGPSAVWPQRGLVMLRADESHGYWESPAPAAAMRLATNYAHNVIDNFALVGFYAFNRPIYLNRQVTPGYASGWSRSIQSHCGLTVDGAEPKFTNATSVRKALPEPVKFVAARSKEVFAGTDLTRSLMLTREYLLDVAHLVSDRPRRCCWFGHALGVQKDDDASRWKQAKLPEGVKELTGVRAFDAGQRAWSMTTLQAGRAGRLAGGRAARPDKAGRGTQGRLPRQWYDRKIGVRMSMLGEAGTTAYAATTPLPVRRVREKGKTGWRHEDVPSEVGGVTVVVARTAPATTFAALHEPFEGGGHRIETFDRIQQTKDGLAVRIVGKPGSGVNDRAMLRLGDNHDKPLTLAGGGESFTFADYAFIRIGPDKVEACGDLRAMKIRVAGRPRLLINDRPVRCPVKDGYLLYSSAPR